MNNTVGAGLDKLISNKPLDQGIKDAWINAGIDTVAQVCANKIGELYKPDGFKPNGFNTTTEAVNKINWGTHKSLHGALGFLCGGMRSKLSGGSFEQGAVAGALGAVVATTVVEMLKPDVTEEMMRCQSEGLNKEEFKEQFMEKAQRSVKWGDFIAATTSFLAGQDVTTSYGTAKNATENNCHPGFAALALTAEACYEVWQAVAAIVAAGGLLALLDSIQVKEHQDGSYGFEGKKYGTLQEVLRKVMETSLLHSIVAVSTIANIMGIDLDANKPTSQTTPIDQGKTPNMITYKDEGKSEDKGFSQLPEEFRYGLKEGFEAYDGPNANVLEQKIYALYGKPGQNGVPNYIGRTSGEVDSMSEADIKSIIKNRDRNHHMNEKGFGDAEPIKASTDYDFIRGLEQLYIDKLGGAQSMGGTSSNAINSISKTNPKREQYLDAVNKDSKD